MQLPTERHPDGEADPRGGRQADHQEDVDENGRERGPRYERRAEMQLGGVARLTREHDTERNNAQQTADGYRDGPPGASEHVRAPVHEQYARRRPDDDQNQQA